MNVRPDDAVDDAVEAMSRKLAQRVSRRGFLTLLGKTVLALVAGSIAEVLLPVDRTVQVAEASSNCSAGMNCGMHGYPCDCCGGTSSTCPSGTTRGSAWTRCCGGISGGCKKIWYYDCCGTGSCSSSCSWCSNSNEPNWCGGAGGNAYRCTLALIGSACGPC